MDICWAQSNSRMPFPTHQSGWESARWAHWWRWRRTRDWHCACPRLPFSFQCAKLQRHPKPATIITTRTIRHHRQWQEDDRSIHEEQIIRKMHFLASTGIRFAWISKLAHMILHHVGWISSERRWRSLPPGFGDCGVYSLFEIFAQNHSCTHLLRHKIFVGVSKTPGGRQSEALSKVAFYLWWLVWKYFRRSGLTSCLFEIRVPIKASTFKTFGWLEALPMRWAEPCRKYIRRIHIFPKIVGVRVSVEVQPKTWA